MFGLRKPQHHKKEIVTVHNYRSRCDSSVNLELDFTTLLPTAQQLESFNSVSTGNTPISSPTTSEGDSYFPPMSAMDLPEPVEAQTPGMEELTEMLNSINVGMYMRTKPNIHDFETWKATLRNHSHADYVGALLYAARKIFELKHDLDNRQKADRFRDIIATEPGGFTSGVPLSIFQWDAITKDSIGRMSIMAIKSAILQACGAIFRLQGWIRFISPWEEHMAKFTAAEREEHSRQLGLKLRDWCQAREAWRVRNGVSLEEDNNLGDFKSDDDLM